MILGSLGVVEVGDVRSRISNQGRVLSVHCYTNLVFRQLMYSSLLSFSEPAAESHNLLRLRCHHMGMSVPLTAGHFVVLCALAFRMDLSFKLNNCFMAAQTSFQIL